MIIMTASRRQWGRRGQLGIERAAGEPTIEKPHAAPRRATPGYKLVGLDYGSTGK